MSDLGKSWEPSDGKPRRNLAATPQRPFLVRIVTAMTDPNDTSPHTDVIRISYTKTAETVAAHNARAA
jgi:hypothetical protein